MFAIANYFTPFALLYNAFINRVFNLLYIYNFLH